MTISASTSLEIWQTLLPEGISPSAKVALLGIGNEFNGDDAAGVQFIRQLQPDVRTPAVLLIEGGTAPENFTGAMRKFAPALVVMVDAAQMELQPGQTALLNPDETEGITASTHTFPLSMLAAYIRQEMGCEVWLIGIQPKGNEPFTPLSPEVETAISELADKFHIHMGRGGF
jgi:hydrogenase 3 maturation protease